MRHRIKIMSAIVILLIIGSYFGYQYYAEYRLRSERIYSLMKYANITDYDKASSFDKKYNYLAVNGEYNKTVLEFFLYWSSNSSLADYYLNTFKSVQEAVKHLLRITRIISLMKYFNTTDYAKVSLFYDKYNYLIIESHNKSLSEFFSYWCLNNTLADLALEILRSVQEANRYLSRLNLYAVNYGSKDDLTLVLSVFTDRDEYPLSGSKVNFTVIILSNKELGYVDIKIFGFKSRFRRYILDNKWIDPTGVLKVPIGKGFNSKSFSIDVPCSPCYRITSGLNNLTCIIKYGGLNLSATKTFLLKEGS